MSVGAIFTRRVRGVRLIEVWAVGILAVLVFGAYLTKTFAGRESAEITSTQAQIEDEQTRIRLLKAEVAYLDQPERIERLSRVYLHLAPLPGKHETDPENLASIARKPVEPVATPSPAPANIVPAQVQPLAMAAITPVAAREDQQ